MLETVLSKHICNKDKYIKMMVTIEQRYSKINLTKLWLSVKMGVFTKIHNNILYMDIIKQVSHRGNNKRFLEANAEISTFNEYRGMCMRVSAHQLSHTFRLSWGAASLSKLWRVTTGEHKGHRVVNCEADFFLKLTVPLIWHYAINAGYPTEEFGSVYVGAEL